VPDAGEEVIGKRAPNGPRIPHSKLMEGGGSDLCLEIGKGLFEKENLNIEPQKNRNGEGFSSLRGGGGGEFGTE